MEIINPNNRGNNPFGDIQPMGCGTDALVPPHYDNGGGGVVCPLLDRICVTDCSILE